MAHLKDFNSTEALKAITINGSIRVESEADIIARRERRMKRKSRWANEQDRVTQFAPTKIKKSSILLPEVPEKPTASTSTGRAFSAPSTESNAVMMSTSIDSSKFDENTQQIYLLRLQIQEATVKLGRADLGIPVNPRERSPSPEPIYNNRGIRINTREDRVRNRLINQRNHAITRLKVLDPTYQPPSQYKYRNTTLEERVMIPAEDYPHINFIGWLLGPRGRSLEELKTKTKCQILIRGKGSVKSGMTGMDKDGRKYDGIDDPLHAYITGQTVEDVKKAAKEIQELINMQVYNPDCEKAVAIRSRHMHELAVLNGTLRDEEVKCLNCGRMGHTTWQCDEKSVFTASVICSACGGVGHVTSDCRQNRPGQVWNPVSSKKSDPKKIDSEYDAFLDDLGEKRDKKEKDGKKEYVPPMGDLKQTLSGNSSAPLMLTNGSCAPGAASAHARAVSTGQPEPQAAGGMLQVMGKSIFGGKLTRITAGFKSQGELEIERRKKVEESNNRPVPLEWQVEKFENHVNKKQAEYIERLERYVEQEKEMKKQAKESEKLMQLAQPPPPPPPGAPGWDSSLEDDGLPKLVGNPMESLLRK